MLTLVIIFGIAVGIWIFARVVALKPGAPYSPDENSGFVDVDDARVHFTKHGAGPVLVLVHGLGAYSFIWRFVTPALTPHFTVVALDLPGFGRSSKPLNISYGLDEQAKRAADALTKLGVETATILGSSMGGAVVLWMAHLWPQRFAKVIALAPATDPTLVPPWMGVYKFLSPALKFGINKRTIRPFVVNAVGRTEIITSEALDAYIEPFRDRNAVAALMLTTMQLLRDQRLPSELHDLQSEVLLLYGEKDRVVPRRVMETLRKILPHVIYKTHPNAGHHPMEDEPEWIVQSVLEFLLKKTV